MISRLDQPPAPATPHTSHTPALPPKAPAGQLPQPPPRLSGLLSLVALRWCCLPSRRNLATRHPIPTRSSSCLPRPGQSSHFGPQEPDTPPQLRALRPSSWTAPGSRPEHRSPSPRRHPYVRVRCRTSANNLAQPQRWRYRCYRSYASGGSCRCHQKEDLASRLVPPLSGRRPRTNCCLLLR